MHSYTDWLTQKSGKRASWKAKQHLMSCWISSSCSLSTQTSRVEKALTHSSTFLSYFPSLFETDGCLLSSHVPHPARLFFHQGIYVYISGGGFQIKKRLWLQSSILRSSKREAATAGGSFSRCSCKDDSPHSLLKIKDKPNRVLMIKQE